MGIHANDVVVTIRKSLSETCPMSTEPRYFGNGKPGWSNRDGTIQFDAVGKDWFRAFRITVEVIDIDEIQDDLVQED